MLCAILTAELPQIAGRVKPQGGVPGTEVEYVCAEVSKTLKSKGNPWTRVAVADIYIAHGFWYLAMQSFLSQ